MTTNTIEQQAIDCERAFWDAMLTMDSDKAARMTDEKCILAGAQGVTIIDPSMMSSLMTSAHWQLHSYEFDDVQVRALDDNTSIVAYKVIEDMTIEQERLTLTAYDTSVWVRDGDVWRCALHTEAPAGDPFGRDKK